MSKRSSRYQFTDKAERDLEGIVDYTVREWGTAQAITYLEGLEARAQLLAENPDLGTARKTISKGLFSFPYESHILYFRKRGGGIVIVRVLHQQMDPLKHL
ncbi:MAG TPA: type II toxin-antitoxin system RelE/ParE family toxin [Thiotrichales bacterium]|nr:type II toxin-antitoxin system RelE/ParE family toxin [Thiotrichales bacterium]